MSTVGMWSVDVGTCERNYHSCKMLSAVLALIFLSTLDMGAADCRAHTPSLLLGRDGIPGRSGLNNDLRIHNGQFASGCHSAM